jgi:phage-related minor tail protein
MSDASTLRSGVGRRAKSKTMPDVIDDVQQKSPKKMVSKSSSKLNLLAKDSSVKSRRQSSKTRQEEIAAQKSEQESAKIQARPSAARPMTEAEREKEEKVLQVFQTAIDQVKEAIVDKQIIFGKLKAELTRMMRVFEKLHALGASASVDAIETEQTVS